jgi:hypothetical protein
MSPGPFTLLLGDDDDDADTDGKEADELDDYDEDEIDAAFDRLTGGSDTDE